MNLEIGTETPIFLFGDICFKFSAFFCLCSVYFSNIKDEKIFALFLLFLSFLLRVFCRMKVNVLLHQCLTAILSLSTVGQCKTNKGLSADNLSV
jgi:hypothetical protein